MASKRQATSYVDMEALIVLGAAVSGGTVVVRTVDDEDASYFIGLVLEWAKEMNFPATRDRTWRVMIARPVSGEQMPNYVGSVETAPADYARDGYRNELVRDLPALPKQAEPRA